MIWLRLVQQGDVRLIDAPLGWYRIRANSLSRDPAKVEAFEHALITAFARTAESTASAGDRVLVEQTVARLKYHQELRRARWALLDGDPKLARRHARLAFTHNPGLRPGLVVASLTISPALLQRLHPYKQRAAARGCGSANAGWPGGPPAPRPPTQGEDISWQRQQLTCPGSSTWARGWGSGAACRRSSG